MDDLYGIMQSVLLRENKIHHYKKNNDQLEQDFFWVTGLDKKNRILFIESVNSRKVDNNIEPVEVFSLALQKQAAHLILYRHSPKGSILPSEQDKDLINRLIQVGIIVNIPILDHQIISSETYVSFKHIGLMQELQKSRKYVPSFESAQRIQTEAAEIIQKRDSDAKATIKLIQKELKNTQEKAKQEKLNIARKLKKENISLAVIAKIVGLSLEKVKEL
ncbi:MAG: JAB domain-containing protein [Aureispira sp.]